MAVKVFEKAGRWFVSVTNPGELPWCQEVGMDKHRAYRIAAIAAKASERAKNMTEFFNNMLEHFTSPSREQMRSLLRLIPGGQTS